MNEDINNSVIQLTNNINSISDGVILQIGNGFTIYYIKTFVDKNYILNAIEKPYGDLHTKFDSYFLTIAMKISPDDALGKIYSGNVVVNYKNQLWTLPYAINKEGRSVGDVSRELSFEGGLEGFVEKGDVNINIIRQFYHDENLITEQLQVGSLGKTSLYLLYDNNLVDKAILQDIKTKISNIKVPVIQAASELQRYLVKGQWLMPLFLVTQRPDRSIRALANGRIVAILDGTPSVLIAPSHFHDFLHTVDDNYLMPIPALFLILLRYLALIVTILLPSLYVAITSYNPEIVRVQLAISIASSRNGVPYPSFIEVTFMLIMLEFLIEASLRLPKTIGQTAPTVGGLILGQAATQAHLVSTIMIIIVAAVAISNFIVPITSMNLAVRVSKYIFILLATLAGIFGIEVGIISMVYYIFSHKCYNRYFLDPVGSFNKNKILSFFNKEKTNG